MFPSVNASKLVPVKLQLMADAKLHSVCSFRIFDSEICISVGSAKWKRGDCLFAESIDHKIPRYAHFQSLFRRNSRPHFSSLLSMLGKKNIIAVSLPFRPRARTNFRSDFPYNAKLKITKTASASDGTRDGKAWSVNKGDGGGTNERRDGKKLSRRCDFRLRNKFSSFAWKCNEMSTSFAYRLERARDKNSARQFICRENGTRAFFHLFWIWWISGRLKSSFRASLRKPTNWNSYRLSAGKYITIKYLLRMGCQRNLCEFTKWRHEFIENAIWLMHWISHPATKSHSNSDDRMRERRSSPRILPVKLKTYRILIMHASAPGTRLWQLGMCVSNIIICSITGRVWISTRLNPHRASVLIEYF